MADLQVAGPKGSSRKTAKASSPSKAQPAANVRYSSQATSSPIKALELLGLKRFRVNSMLGGVVAVEDGLPVKVLDRLVNKVAPGDKQFVYGIVPSATLARRRLQAVKNPDALLSTEESARAVRLVRVFCKAAAVWGSEESARRFLNTPHILLDGRTPMDISLKTDEGARLVEELLGKLEYGTAL